MKKAKTLLGLLSFSTLGLGAANLCAAPTYARETPAQVVVASSTPVPRGESGTYEEMERYAARQESSKDLEEFRGGFVVIVAFGILAFILILVAILVPW